MIKISVVIPAYNAEEHIVAALASAISQSYRDIEIIVVNDGSTDETRKIIEHFTTDNRVHIYNISNSGVSKARNFAVRVSSGEWLAFLDADDVWKRTKIERFLQIVEDYQDIVLYYGLADCQFSRGAELDDRNQLMSSGVGVGPPGYNNKNFRRAIVENMDIPTSSVVIRRDVFDIVGGFAEQETDIEDTLLWYQVLEHGSWYMDEERLVSYRLHATSWNLKNKHNLELYSRRYRLYLELMVNVKHENRKHVFLQLIRIGLRRLVFNFIKTGLGLDELRFQLLRAKRICSKVEYGTLMIFLHLYYSLALVKKYARI